MENKSILPLQGRRKDSEEGSGQQLKATEKDECFDIFMIFQTQIHSDQWLVRFKFLQRTMDGKNLIRFQSKGSFSKLLRRKHLCGLT